MSLFSSFRDGDQLRKGIRECDLQVLTSFSCTCLGCLQCQVCGKGRTYKCNVRTTDCVQAIFECMKSQNPEFDTRNIEVQFLFNKELLDMQRRIINYDMPDHSKVTAITPPGACCHTSFRREPHDLEKQAKVKKEMEARPEDCRSGRDGESDPGKPASPLSSHTCTTSEHN